MKQITEPLKSPFMMKMSAAMIAASCIAAPLPAAAAANDTIDTTKTASLTIHKYDITAANEDNIDTSAFQNDGKTDPAAETALKDYAIAGVEFSYVKVGDINVKSENGNLGVLYDIPDDLETLLGLTDSRGDNRYTSDELNDALKALLTDNTAGKNALESYFASSGSKTTMPHTDEHGMTSASNLPLGLYLLVETKVPANVDTTVNPFFVSLPMTDLEGDDWFYDVNVYPKNQTNIPTLDKLVKQHDDTLLPYADTATGSEGDQMDYLFVSHLPKITSGSTYLKEYTFTDRMDKGLTYNKDQVEILFYDNEADARANNREKALKTWSDTTFFSVSYDETDTSFSQMTVTPTAAGLSEIDPALSEAYLVVSYNAVVNSDDSVILGDTGNCNDVTLKWKRTSMDYIDTLEDRAKVYSFGIDLTKEFSDSRGDATEVQFVLQNQTDGHYVTANSDTAGKYYVTDASKGTQESEGTILSPAPDGTLSLYGLEADTYVLTEIHTDNGYSLLKAPITIDIKCTEDTITPSRTTLYDLKDIADNPNKTLIETAGTRASATVDNENATMNTHTAGSVSSSNARVAISVLNTRDFTLPNTGGYGTILCTLSGAVIALAGVTIATKKKKEV